MALAIVNKHLNILIYLTKVSKIGENLWTNYEIRQKLAEIRHKFAQIHKNICKIGTWYTTTLVYARYTGIRTCIPVYPNVFQMCDIMRFRRIRVRDR